MSAIQKFLLNHAKVVLHSVTRAQGRILGGGGGGGGFGGFFLTQGFDQLPTQKVPA